MNPTRRLQSTARLALLAMLLLLVAPLFSQGLASATQAPAWLSEMACGEGGHDQLPHDAPPWAQCGYCTLLLSSPALAGSLADLSGAALCVATVPAQALPLAPGEPVIRHDAPPRAPPQRSV